VIEVFVFAIAAVIVVGGAVGVVLSANPVHAALSLVATLFGIAVLFVAQDAHFLAAVQVIVYAGAIVVLFLFVIMLLGVDRSEDLEVDPLGGQRPAAVIAGAALLGAALVELILTHRELDSVAVGTHSVVGKLSDPAEENVVKLGRALFTDYLFAFEITSVLLVIAVVAAVVLARRAARLPGDTDVDVVDDEAEVERR
jgi:NADH-quinone oxidoreductase subunit J